MRLHGIGIGVLQFAEFALSAKIVTAVEFPLFVDRDYESMEMRSFLIQIKGPADNVILPKGFSEPSPIIFEPL